MQRTLAGWRHHCEYGIARTSLKKTWSSAMEESSKKNEEEGEIGCQSQWRFSSLTADFPSKNGKADESQKIRDFRTGKVTPVQVAFIVDRYLCDNHYTQARSAFRSEASTLISKAQGREAPKSLLSLGAILDEYICLKEQKVILQHEKCRMEQERCRVEALLRGLQNAMHAYNNSGIISPPSMSMIDKTSMASITQSASSSKTPGGYPIYSIPAVNSNTMPSNTSVDLKNSTSIPSLPPKNKRKGSKLVPDASLTAKKTCSQSPMMSGGTNRRIHLTDTPIIQESVLHIPVIPSSPCKRIPNRSPVQGSTVAKSLFKQSSPSPDPKTPPQALPSQTDKLVSPLENSSVVNSSSNNTQDIAPTTCPIDSSEVAASPYKHVAYFSVERNHYISSSPNKTSLKRLVKRDHVKGRLDFDDSSGLMNMEEPTAQIYASGSSRQAEIFDMDIPNFDVFGADFSLSELLVDIDLESEGIGFPGQPVLESSGNIPSSPHESGDGDMEVNEIFSELSSTVTEVLSEKDMNIQGSDSLKSLKSITKCIRILSPAKSQQTSMLDQENLSQETYKFRN